MLIIIGKMYYVNGKEELVFAELKRQGFSLEQRYGPHGMATLIYDGEIVGPIDKIGENYAGSYNGIENDPDPERKQPLSFSGDNIETFSNDDKGHREPGLRLEKVLESMQI